MKASYEYSATCHQRFPSLRNSVCESKIFFEVRVDSGGLGVDLIRRLQACFHNCLAERAQLCPVRHQALNRLWIARIISRLNIHIGVAAGDREQRLVRLRQGIPLFRIEEEVQRRSALPPTRIVILLDDFVEAELLVVIRADPFGCIDSAFFQGRIDIAARDLLEWC